MNFEPTRAIASTKFHNLVQKKKIARIGGDCVSLALVVSPLTSLMTDQVVNVRAKGVSSANMTTACARRVQDDIVASERDLEQCSLLYRRHVRDSIVDRGHRYLL